MRCLLQRRIVRRWLQRLRELRRILHNVQRAERHRLHRLPLLRALPARRCLHRGLPSDTLCKQRVVVRCMRLELLDLQRRGRKQLSHLPRRHASSCQRRVYVQERLPGDDECVHPDR